MSRDDGWTTVFHRRPECRHRVVFFPHAGGSAGAGAALSAAAPPSVEVVSIQYPGRQWRRAEPPAIDLRELARSVARALQSMDDKPIAILGHSMGAVVGFETTLLLDADRPGLVTRLFASGSGAPSRPRRLRMAPDAGDEVLIEELRRMGGTDEMILNHREALLLTLPALRDDYRAMTAYSARPGARIAAPITALLGEDDPATSYDDAVAWGEFTYSGFDLRTFPGGHFYLNRCRDEVLDTVLKHLPDSPS